jgi:hypothetical protein
MFGHNDLFDIQIHQQIADLTVGGNAGFFAAGFQVGVIDDAGKVCGIFVLIFIEKLIMIL